jgi:hypothetical protein
LNVAVKVPLEMEQVELLTGLPRSEQATSPKEKPEPDTVIVLPVGPEVGFRVITGPSTVKEAEAESPPGLPVVVIK